MRSVECALAANKLDAHAPHLESPLGGRDVPQWPPAAFLKPCEDAFERLRCFEEGVAGKRGRGAHVYVQHIPLGHCLRDAVQLDLLSDEMPLGLREQCQVEPKPVDVLAVGRLLSVVRRLGDRAVRSERDGVASAALVRHRCFPSVGCRVTNFLEWMSIKYNVITVKASIAECLTGELALGYSEC